MTPPVETGRVEMGNHGLEFARYPATDDDAPAIVMLHEGLGSVAMWRNFPSRVAEATHGEVFVYSRRGYGRSSPRTAPYRVGYMHEEAREVLPRLFEAWELESPVLLGHSDGASIALIQAAQSRSPVRALALMAPHILVEPVSVQSIAEARRQFLATDLAERLGRYHDDPAMAFWGWNDIWLLDAFLDWDIRPLLADIQCPVLAIQGEEDAYGTMAQIDGIADAARGPVELLKLPGCGHSPQRDRPDDVLSALRAFIGGLS